VKSSKANYNSLACFNFSTIRIKEGRVSNSKTKNIAPQGGVKKSINVMVVDDSPLYRNLFAGILNRNDGIRVISSAENGNVAIENLKGLKKRIDVITLDIQMPEKDGLEALPELLKISPNVKIIMVSSLTSEGKASTLESLSKGAADYLAKPEISSEASDDVKQFTDTLVEKVAMLGDEALKLKTANANKPDAASYAPQPAKEPALDLHKILIPKRPNALVIGSSTGGPQALGKIFNDLKGKKLTAPLFITQHMPAEFTTLLAKQLSATSGHDVREGVDGEVIENGRVYLAPGGFHMLVEDKNGQRIIRITDDAPENFCRPAVDPMLRSIAKSYGGNTLLMILTGMGTDGRAGAKHIIDAGGMVIAQDKKSSVVWGMPGAVATAGYCTHIQPIDELSQTFIKQSQGQIQ
jgi:two-component system chemotaxis response regulator CheB